MNLIQTLAYGAPPLFAILLGGLVQVGYAVSVVAAIVAVVQHFRGRSSYKAARVAIVSGILPVLLCGFVVFKGGAGEFFRDPITVSLIVVLLGAMVSAILVFRAQKARRLD